MTDLLELADRCEGAAGGDRTLASAVLRSVGWKVVDGIAFNPEGNRVMRIPDPTKSLDDAMTLVPDGAGFNLDRYWTMNHTGPVWRCDISTGGIPSNPRQVFSSEDVANAALAATAAALRARALGGSGPPTSSKQGEQNG